MSKRISCKKCRHFRRGLTCDFCGLHYYGLSFYDICDDYIPRKGVDSHSMSILTKSDAV